MPGHDCVPDAELQAFLLGELPARLAGRVASHLESCPACEAAARRLDEVTDPFMRSLRRAFVPGPGDTMPLRGGAAAAAPPAADADDVPRQVAGYEVLGVLGRGGTGVVYKARQAHPARLVALKMILASAHALPECRARFLAEADAIARLQHPNIVQVYEVGEHGGLPFLALEFLAGGSLARGLRGQPQPPRRAAELVETLARAVHHAHRRGIVHRDLKPSNVLLTEDGTPKVSDFGLAKLEGADLTSTGSVLGTPSYMAPEQARGDSRGVGPAADTYALGALLYELLTGRPPFREATALETLRQVVAREAVPPGHLAAGTPRELGTICLKCLEKEPRKRYATALDLADDLRHFLDGEPIKARPVGVLGRASRWARRNPGWAATLATVAGLLLVIAVGASVMTLRLDRALRVSDAERLRAQGAERDANRRLWESYRDQAEARRLSRRMGQRFDGLQAVAAALALTPDLDRSAERVLELRNRAIACLALPDVRVVKEWDGWPAGSLHLDFDDGLRRYVRTDRQGNVSVRRVADDAELAHFVSEIGGAWPRLSADGRFLALEHRPRYELWRLDGPEPTRLALEADGGACDFSPDSRWGAVVGSDGGINLYDLDQGASVRHLPPGPHPVHAAAFHPGKHRLAVSHGGGVQVRDLDTGAVVADLAQAGAEHLAWAPDGKRLAVVGADRAIHLWDAEGSREVWALRRWKNGGLRIAFSHGGNLLASIGWEQMLRLWDLRTNEELFHTPASYAGTALRFRGDDRVLAADVKDSRLRLWEMVPGPECRRLIRSPGHGRAPYGPFAVSPDGRILAARTRDGFGLWTAGEGAALAAVPAGGVDCVLFEPSGALLTAGPAGVFRWPARPGAGSAAAVRLGPPQRLPFPEAGGAQLACGGAGRVVAAARGWGALVWSADHPDGVTRLAPHEGARTVAVSPDGRWVATGSQDGAGVRVWEAATGKPVKDLLPQEGWAGVRFSPDGRWLATGGNGLRLWAVGSWQEGPSLDGIPGAAFAFSPAEKLLAAETGYGAVRLVDPDTGREYARLEDPDQTRAAWVCFSPDGTQLLTAGGGDAAWIRAWDLRALRGQLAAMDLDWEGPGYPPAGAGSPVELEVVTAGGPAGR